MKRTRLSLRTGTQVIRCSGVQGAGLKRKRLSLTGILAAFAAIACAAAGRPAAAQQTLGANCNAGPGTTTTVQFMANGTNVSGALSGWVYVCFANGETFSGNFATLSVYPSSDGTNHCQATALGFLNDVTPVTCVIWCKSASGTTPILDVDMYDYYNPHICYIGGVNLNVQSGFIDLAH